MLFYSGKRRASAIRSDPRIGASREGIRGEFPPFLGVHQRESRRECPVRHGALQQAAQHAHGRELSVLRNLRRSLLRSSRLPVHTRQPNGGIGLKVHTTVPGSQQPQVVPDAQRRGAIPARRRLGLVQHLQLAAGRQRLDRPRRDQPGPRRRPAGVAQPRAPARRRDDVRRGPGQRQRHARARAAGAARRARGDRHRRHDPDRKVGADHPAARAQAPAAAAAGDPARRPRRAGGDRAAARTRRCSGSTSWRSARPRARST